MFLKICIASFIIVVWIIFNQVRKSRRETLPEKERLRGAERKIISEGYIGKGRKLKLSAYDDTAKQKDLKDELLDKCMVMFSKSGINLEKFSNCYGEHSVFGTSYANLTIGERININVKSNAEYFEFLMNLRSDSILLTELWRLCGGSINLQFYDYRSESCQRTWQFFEEDVETAVSKAIKTITAFQLKLLWAIRFDATLQRAIVDLNKRKNVEMVEVTGRCEEQISSVKRKKDEILLEIKNNRAQEQKDLLNSVLEHMSQ